MAPRKDAIKAAVILCTRALQAEIRNAIIKRKRKRRLWVRKWIYRRPTLGASNNLFKELALEDPVAYRKVLRLTREKFEELLEKVHPLIQKKDTALFVHFCQRFLMQSSKYCRTI
ncbi:hypothetical protein ALC60_04957 [Trachymyrmex zeteki]|uniref:Uncharacterized protein n=1 Tax=Mycetomoellerius zeteki TaxID=64791 RepID=A0A151X731_9HYME|nr:hypothetical protein ALC60_04957 [Trachymyrmex zeteki]